MPPGVLSEATKVRASRCRYCIAACMVYTHIQFHVICMFLAVYVPSVYTFVRCCADAAVAVTTGEARAHGDEHASWAVALQPCTRNDRKRIRVAFVSCLPRSVSELQEARPSLIWGIASSGHTSWHEPPAGWSTQPDSSWDVGHGAWGTESDEAEQVRIATDDVPVFSVVIDLPWSGSLCKRNGIAFKWRWPSGKKELWFGDPETGRNLSVRASFAQVFHASGDSDGVLRHAHAISSALPAPADRVVYKTAPLYT